MDGEASLFDEVDEASNARALAEGLADIEAGRVISNKAMMAWINSWGTENELPPPQVSD